MDTQDINLAPLLGLRGSDFSSILRFAGESRHTLSWGQCWGRRKKDTQNLKHCRINNPCDASGLLLIHPHPAATTTSTINQSTFTNMPLSTLTCFSSKLIPYPYFLIRVWPTEVSHRLLRSKKVQLWNKLRKVEREKGRNLHRAQISLVQHFQNGHQSHFFTMATCSNSNTEPPGLT